MLHYVASLHTEAHHRRGRGLTAHNPHSWPPSLEGSGNPGHEASPAHSHEHEVEVRALVEDLEAERALAGDHLEVIVGGDKLHREGVARGRGHVTPSHL